MQADIQRERERTENASARTVEIEAKLRKEELHSNALLNEIERLKRRIRSHSRPIPNENDIDLPASDTEELGSDANTAPGSNNMPRIISAGKLDVKIRMPLPYD